MKWLMVLLCCLPLLASAQPSENLMYSNGRIYVVIVVMLIILLGLVLYLVRLERKIKKIEDKDQQV
ncbi:CcmD family protein [Niabella insulamsoli]|uniref:CcmD family protein n=1 Tax=Niabella insulamsoli TaxID=3144874 RepID=UPI0031FC8A89